MAKITELVRRVYRYEQRSAVETAYPSNVLLLLAAIVLVINLCNNSMIDEKDSYTRQHSQRVAEYARLIAENMPGNRYTEQELDDLYRSALLHDIGKIAIPDAILKKTDRLSDEEFVVMKTHPTWGRKILDGLEFLPGVAHGAGYHHERYDGRGYPEGTNSSELPEAVRIISAADALDAMNSNRCYRRHCSRAYILGELCKGSGTRFDPACVQAMLEIM